MVAASDTPICHAARVRSGNLISIRLRLFPSLGRVLADSTSALGHRGQSQPPWAPTVLYLSKALRAPHRPIFANRMDLTRHCGILNSLSTTSTPPRTQDHPYSRCRDLLPTTPTRNTIGIYSIPTPILMFRPSKVPTSPISNAWKRRPSASAIRPPISRRKSRR